ncbi:hypothetical protein J6590_021013 [Homalodisca vitripennis]|nr:hypothetical protein J6590_021013 [Homalodisca vitripennis]
MRAILKSAVITPSREWTHDPLGDSLNLDALSPRALRLCVVTRQPTTAQKPYISSVVTPAPGCAPVNYCFTKGKQLQMYTHSTCPRHLGKIATLNLRWWLENVRLWHTDRQTLSAPEVTQTSESAGPHGGAASVVYPQTHSSFRHGLPDLFTCHKIIL